MRNLRVFAFIIGFRTTFQPIGDSVTAEKVKIEFSKTTFTHSSTFSKKLLRNEEARVAGWWKKRKREESCPISQSLRLRNQSILRADVVLYDVVQKRNNLDVGGYYPKKGNLKKKRSLLYSIFQKERL